MNKFKPIFFLGALAVCLVALLYSRGGGAEEMELGWTDNLELKDGLFAFRADLTQRRVLLFRADDRAASPGRQFRLRLPHAGGDATVVSLRRAEGVGPPWRYGADVKGWDGVADSADLEASEDGKRWTTLGTFHKP